ncbi:MAG: hypothetical protein P4L71_15425 [Acetobacteraceae bacterium]|nr:hypothetical protein [Acetobacteraceae bacterium]
MDNEATHLTPGEVRRIIGRLRGPDLLRLATLARAWATGLRQHDADDLLIEALDRVLSGLRPWPSQVSLPAFLSQVMRSIASQWKWEDHREPLKEDVGEALLDEESRHPAARYELDDLISRKRGALGAEAISLTFRSRRTAMPRRSRGRLRRIALLTPLCGGHAPTAKRSE